MTKPYLPTCGITDCLPTPEAAPPLNGTLTWRCQHGRRFILCSDGGWEPFLTKAESAEAEERNRPRTAAWEALLARLEGR